MNTYYFVFFLLDDDGNPAGDFAPIDDGQQVKIVMLHGGAPQFMAAIMQAMLDQVALTVGQMEFEWGTVIVHLPQVFDDTPSELVQRVLASAENMFFDMIDERHGVFETEGPTGPTGPDDSGLNGIQGPTEIDATLPPYPAIDPHDEIPF